MIVGVTLRIGIGGLWHETNTFVPGRTELSDFASYRLADGPQAVREALEGTATEIGGALAACGELGFEPVPFFYAAAVPGPMIAADARAFLWERFLERLEEARPLDGLLLALHGAMVAEELEDPESDLLARVRERVGSIPIAAVLDLHANPGDGLVTEVDILLAYETYPHTDAAERAAEAARLLGDTIEGELAPLATGRRLPLLTCPLVQATASEPMASLLAAARRVRARPGIAAASLVPGYPYADVERLGFAVLVTGDGETADAAADELAEAAWSVRDAFRPQLASAAEAVEHAIAAEATVVLAEVADNVGGGAPGNATELLGALIDTGATGAVAVLHDPAAAAEAAAAGEGAEVAVQAGDPPILLSGRVAHAGDTAYRRTGSYMTGQEVDMGLCAVVATGGVEVVLTSRRVMPFDADHLQAVGVEPAERRILVVKSAIAWQAAFGELAGEAVYVDTPGPCTCRLETLPYSRVVRPIAPLDDVTDPV
jgi:microcystin degradation protein MlrC